MRTSTNNRRRTQPRVESLEGKTLLSTGLVTQSAAHHVAAAPMVSQATSTFTGTLSGRYSNVYAPYFAYILNYATSGTLTGPGSTHLAGTLFVRPGAPAGRFDGRLVLHNPGGSMILNVYSTATLGTYTYNVAFAGGSDTPFRGGTGTLTVQQTPTLRVPYYVQGHATLTFS
jgi:hypothetical protein